MRPCLFISRLHTCLLYAGIHTETQIECDNPIPKVFFLTHIEWIIINACLNSHVHNS